MKQLNFETLNYELLKINLGKGDVLCVRVENMGNIDPEQLSKFAERVRNMFPRIQHPQIIVLDTNIQMEVIPEYQMNAIGWERIKGYKPIE